MGYRKATTVLPRHVLRAVQQYIEGECIYIPRREETKKAWGENTGAKQVVRARNQEIAAKRLAGYSVSDLAEQYFLSVKTIYKIINTVKNG